ncbi:MAG TPA: hypothetical protein VLJ68_08615 [Chitinophagaceae bacterium]|nr:hypothetical protein [Chitinophagaceae bacterium]
MKDFEKKLSEFQKSNPVSVFYEFGMSPDDVKSAIVDSFNEYFQNPKTLNEHAIPDLVGTWLSYLTIYRDYPDSIDFIQKILDIFNEAKRVNESQTIEAYVKWFPELNQSISRFWSLYNSQSNILELCIEDFLEEALRVIGQSIEGLAKPFLKLLLHLNRCRGLRGPSREPALSKFRISSF